jgi:hypothetical protein
VVEAGPALNPKGETISHTAVADRLWRYWTDDRLDVQVLMMKLAEREADFQRSFPISEFDGAATAVLANLPVALRVARLMSLPASEQYRYVAYNPAHGGLDWSHEREWRWPLEGEPWEDDGSPPGEADELLLRRREKRRGLRFKTAPQGFGSRTSSLRIDAVLVADPSV